MARWAYLTAEDLNDAYKKILEYFVLNYRPLAIRVAVKVKRLEFQRDPELERMSFILVDEKLRYVLKTYWDEILQTKGKKKLYELPRKCITKVEVRPPLLRVYFKRARLFPNLYVDLLAISKVAPELGCTRGELWIQESYSAIVLPYIFRVALKLGISRFSEEFLQAAQKVEQLYLDIISGKELPPTYNYGKVAIFYGAHVLGLYSRIAARRHLNEIWVVAWEAKKKKQASKKEATPSKASRGGKGGGSKK